MMKTRPGVTLLELLLAIALASILGVSIAIFVVTETRVFTMISDQQDSSSRLMDTYLLMQKVLKGARTFDINSAFSTKIVIASGPIPIKVFEFVPAENRLFWLGSPILENVLATFSYTNQTTDLTTKNWADTPVGWDPDDYATGSVRVELQILNSNSDRILFITHPRED